MKSKFRKMLQESLSERAQAFALAREVHPPSRGLAAGCAKCSRDPAKSGSFPLHISPAAFKALETREAHGAITLKSIRKAADALGCDFVYAVLPRHGSFQEVIGEQAHAKATRLVESVSHSMALEQQATGKVKQRIAEVAAELAANPRRLWDDL